MITKEEVLIFHTNSLEEYKEDKSIRDSKLLDSAISRPYHTFDGIELYADIFEKTAAIVETLIINHPFMKGNKRTAKLTMDKMLSNSNLYISVSDDIIHSLTFEIAIGKVRFDEIVDFLKINTSVKQGL
jgi:death on curing protein